MDRIDIAPDGSGCRIVWRNTTIRTPSAVAKGDTANGLIYTYEKPKDPGQPGAGVWYWAALDYRTGRVVWQHVAGHGGLYNNHYAGIALGRNRATGRTTLYLGGIGGIVALRDGAGLSADTSAYNSGLALGTEAYMYGVPLLDTERIFTTGTSVNAPNGNGYGPLNEFSNIQKLANASERTVVAPNNDTLYSLAWLDLRHQPQVLHAPPIHHRFWEFELVDPWTNNFYNITSIPTPLGPGDYGVRSGGNWAVLGPGFKGRLPRGVKRINSPYTRVWVIGRTFIGGRSDLVDARRIQDQYSITPLSEFGTSYEPKRPRHLILNPTEARIPGTGAGEDPLAFYAALGREMVKFPAPASDRPLLRRLRAIGIGPELSPTGAHLSADTLRGLRDAVTQGPNNVITALLALYQQGFKEHDGYLIGDLGHWGTDYKLRAIGDRVGVGGQRANIATYPLALVDDTMAPLTGSKRYVLHIPRSRLPIPVSAFWSLTMYSSKSFFVRNPINRYLLNDLSHLRTNADGSIDIYVQHQRPTDAALRSNWLPSPGPGAGFRLIWRLYGLGTALGGVLDGTGWQPPLIQPCGTTGRAADGTLCAS